MSTPHDDIFVTRRQLRDFGAGPMWFDRHMKGRGKIAFSKLITCAPADFWPCDFDPAFSGRCVWAHGETNFFKDGELHREDGPAQIFQNGTERWWLFSRLHRLDGPAVVRTTGRHDFYLHGVHFPLEEDHAQGVFALEEIEKQVQDLGEKRKALIFVQKKIVQARVNKMPLTYCGMNPLGEPSS